MTASVFDVAEHILERFEDSAAGGISSMRLQKLCYYAQAWHLSWDGTPLFQEEIQAWASGPVIPALYEAHKGTFLLKAGDIRRALQDPEVRARVQARLDEQAERGTELPDEREAPTDASILRHAVKDALRVSPHNTKAIHQTRALRLDGSSVVHC